ncbi:NfeD family protein [Geitlerinema sp. PCC 9228]|jgi:membrane protein implicated in regulation of membrane protease activity|uniref:NfeD family protein n=1 Tax=Geitlerinema sp. PCC 9228 TaxID=111611 RepID=UPI0008F9C924|nr:NfeD family protein [Geitlerinema sp. PCC 9228]
MKWFKQCWFRWFSSPTSPPVYLPNGQIKADDRYQGEAIVEEAIALGKPGRVYFRGSWYPARCCQNVVMQVGQRVIGIGRSGIEMVVEPLPENYEDL